MKLRDLSNTMLAATALAMAALLVAAFVAPTCRRGPARQPIVIVDTVAPSRSAKPKTPKAPKDSTAHKKKTKTPRKETPPPSSRDYLDEPAN